MPNSKMATAHPQCKLYLLPLHSLPSQTGFCNYKPSIYLSFSSFNNGYQVNYYFVNVIESNTSIFTVFIYPWLDSFVIAAENTASTNFRTWDIVLATAAPSFASTFAPALYEVQYCFRSWWIQTANWREVT